MDLKSLVRSIPDFPKEGILFRDITPLIADPDGFQELIGQMADKLKDKNIDVVVGPEARGFIFSAALAQAMKVGLVLARKPGKLPYKTISYEYSLEYGTDELLHKIHIAFSVILTKLLCFEKSEQQAAPIFGQISQKLFEIQEFYPFYTVKSAVLSYS